MDGGGPLYEMTVIQNDLAWNPVHTYLRVSSLELFLNKHRMDDVVITYIFDEDPKVIMLLQDNCIC